MSAAGAHPQKWAYIDCLCTIVDAYRSLCLYLHSVPRCSELYVDVYWKCSLSRARHPVYNTKCRMCLFRLVEMRSSICQIAAALTWLFAGLIVANGTNDRKPVTLMYLTG